MAADLAALLEDLVAETASLDSILDGLREDQWSLPTPAPGWNIADQVGHLAYFDEAALLSMTDPRRFRQEAAALVAGGADFPDRMVADHRHLAGAEVFHWFRTARRRLLAGYADLDPAGRLPWYGPDMGVASSITARLMETWAHGQDIADTVGVQRTPTARLRQVVHLGISALPYSYAINGLAIPSRPIRVELLAPDGETWIWGPDIAENLVVGSALDFALVVTQRRHRDDTDLIVTGATALEWIGIAQAFAGAPGVGRPPAVGAVED